MDENLEIIEPIFSASFGKAVAKTLLISTATSVGVMTGFVIVGFAINEVQKWRNKNSTPATVTPAE